MRQKNFKHHSSILVAFKFPEIFFFHAQKIEIKNSVYEKMKTWFETEKINILNATLETKEKLTVVKSNLNMIQRIIFWCIKTVMHVDLYYDYAS